MAKTATETHTEAADEFSGILGNAKSSGSTTTDRVVNGSLEKLFNKAMGPTKKYAAKQVAELRSDNPNLTGPQLLIKLEERYLKTVTGSGAAVGGASAMPGVGFFTGLAAAFGDAGFFLVATMSHVYSVAELTDTTFADDPAERALLLTILSGGSSSAAVKQASKKAGGSWASKLLNGGAQQASLFNKILGKRILAKIGARQGFMTVGKLLPFGVGAVVGGGLNRALGKAMINATRETFKDLANA